MRVAGGIFDGLGGFRPTGMVDRIAGWPIDKVDGAWWIPTGMVDRWGRGGGGEGGGEEREGGKGKLVYISPAPQGLPLFRIALYRGLPSLRCNRHL